MAESLHPKHTKLPRLRSHGFQGAQTALDRPNPLTQLKGVLEHELDPFETAIYSLQPAIATFEATVPTRQSLALSARYLALLLERADDRVEYLGVDTQRLVCSLSSAVLRHISSKSLRVHSSTRSQTGA